MRNLCVFGGFSASHRSGVGLLGCRAGSAQQRCSTLPRAEGAMRVFCWEQRGEEKWRLTLLFFSFTTIALIVISGFCVLILGSVPDKPLVLHIIFLLLGRTALIILRQATGGSTQPVVQEGIAH